MIFLFASVQFSEIIAQSIFEVSVDPKNATTVFIDFNGKLELETWDEDYIILQIKVEPGPEEEKLSNLLSLSQQNFIKQEFTFNNFLLLTITNFDQLTQSINCDLDQLLSFKIIAPKSLDLELRCKNDMVIYDDLLESNLND